MTTTGKMEDAIGYPLRLASPLFAFFLVFFVIPLLILAWMSLHSAPDSADVGFTQYIRFLGDELSMGVLVSTLWIGVEATLLSLLLGFPLAWAFTKSPNWLRSALMLIILMPLLTSVVMRTFAWIVILGRQGIVNETLISLGLINTPLRLLYTEGGLVVALAQVLLPLSLPGVMAGCLLTYAAAVTAFITQSLVGGGQKLFMPMYIYQQATSLLDWPFAAAISIIFLGAVLAVVWLFNRLGRLSQGFARA